jgi:hypothetical protein
MKYEGTVWHKLSTCVTSLRDTSIHHIFYAFNSHLANTLQFFVLIFMLHLPRKIITWTQSQASLYVLMMLCSRPSIINLTIHVCCCFPLCKCYRWKQEKHSFSCHVKIGRINLNPETPHLESMSVFPTNVGSWAFFWVHWVAF